ncbi:Wzz/FepE/Etk N-terminal domain-containing protein [Limosilactobacillus difficilis]|uniref:Wzz/FepE/Etk N-terminal domain-containing protein n=1 Tax=Limosilactobacillus difficilis TaxID=2991838 RepID=UPI0024BB4FED|nr:Wzz/FepE/Etk N-terminal domain-containing protein [Limosilactobacillus difficilis]
MQSYSVHDIFKIIIKDLLIIVILAFTFGALLWGYAKHKQTISYTSERNILVGHNSPNNQIHYKNSQVNADLSKTQTYSDIIQDRVITDQAYSLLAHNVKKHVTKDDVKDDVHVENHPQSLVLTIKTHAKTAKDATAIANATAQATKKELPKITSDVGSVKLLSSAKVKNAQMKKSVSAKKYGILGFAFGALLGMVISFVMTSWKHLLR